MFHLIARLVFDLQAYYEELTITIGPCCDWDSYPGSHHYEPSDIPLGYYEVTVVIAVIPWQRSKLCLHRFTSLYQREYMGANITIGCQVTIGLTGI